MTNYRNMNLTNKQKVGQVLMFGFDAEVINEHALKMIRDYQIGNVILFTRNIKNSKQLYTLIQDLQKLAIKHIGIPLFIAIDQEGGMVTRIQNDATFFPGAMTISAAGGKDIAYNIGDLMGMELKALGINLNYAPVLDTNNNPHNPVIGVRSYSDNPKIVAQNGNAFINGLQKHIIATAKHFPGHGDTYLDSHLALPTVDHDIERLEAIELYPFKYAIDHGLHAIMSSHIVFPSFDEIYPATLSKTILTHLLRDELHFEGLIATDCLQMKAIQNHFSTPEAALLSLNAGANLMCVCHDFDLQARAQGRLLNALDTQELSISILNERVERVLLYKENHIEINLDQPFEEIEHILLKKENVLYSENVTKKAVTLVKGKQIMIDNHTLLLNILPKATTIADETDTNQNLIDRLRKTFENIDIISIGLEPSNIEILEVLAMSKKYKKVAVMSYNANIFKSQQKLIELLNKTNVELHVLAMRNPYDLHFIPNIQNYVCFYEYTPNSINALIAYLKGDLVPEGRLPINEK